MIVMDSKLLHDIVLFLVPILLTIGGYLAGVIHSRPKPGGYIQFLDCDEDGGSCEFCFNQDIDWVLNQEYVIFQIRKTDRMKESRKSSIAKNS